ncbi:unnamed protein product [Soboliphyme baturini]|uniref:PRKCSH domain-containing protein n=1 Tax=Soboliphyme baturini TaxID=241478 RepID=A0A183J807_9BILA|nr:unnamed protein product [Soboliphyme baturini]
MEEIETVAYDMSIGPEPIIDQQPLDVETDFVISNRFGQKYLCSQPNRSVIEGMKRWSVTDDFDFSSFNISKHLDFLSSLPCLEKSYSYWTYRFCYKNEVVQYHVIDDDIINMISLGKYKNEFDWHNYSNPNGSSATRQRTLYHSQWYDLGSMCDLNNRFRETEVRFHCEEGIHGAYLYQVEELQSCRYTFVVHTSSLCHLKAFLPARRKSAPLPVQCRPLLTERDYEKFLQYKAAREAAALSEESAVQQEAVIEDEVSEDSLGGGKRYPRKDADEKTKSFMTRKTSSSLN